MAHEGCILKSILTDEQKEYIRLAFAEIEKAAQILITNHQVRHELYGQGRFWIKLIDPRFNLPYHLSISTTQHRPRCPECSHEMIHGTIQGEGAYFCYVCKSTWTKTTNK